MTGPVAITADCEGYQFLVQALLDDEGKIKKNTACFSCHGPLKDPYPFVMIADRIDYGCEMSRPDWRHSQTDLNEKKIELGTKFTIEEYDEDVDRLSRIPTRLTKSRP